MIEVLGDQDMEELEQISSKRATDGLTAGMLRDYIQELEEQKARLIAYAKDYKKKFDQEKLDQADIYFYLNKKLDDNYELVANLENQLITEQNEREVAERLYEKKIEDLEKKLTQEQARYMNRVSELEERLQSLKDFGDQKDEVDRNLNNLMNILEKERTQFRINAEEMEKRTIQERERLRKQKEKDIEDLRNQMQSTIEEKISKKTKKTRVMNSLMKKELSYQSAQAVSVADISRDIAEGDRSLRRDLELCQSTESEMAKRLASQQRLIKQLNEKLEQQADLKFNMREDYEDRLEAQTQEICELEKKLADLETKSVEEIQLRDDFWDFVYRTHNRLAARQRQDSSLTQKRMVPLTSDVGKSLSEGSIDSTTVPPGEDEQLLQELFRRVMHREPVRMKQLLRLGHKSTASAVSTVSPPTQYLPTLSVTTSIASFMGADSVVSDTLEEAKPSEAPSPVTVAGQSVATRIPPWDARARRRSRHAAGDGVRMAKSGPVIVSTCMSVSVGVQTDSQWGTPMTLPVVPVSSTISDSQLNSSRERITNITSRNRPSAMAVSPPTSSVLLRMSLKSRGLDPGVTPLSLERHDRGTRPKLRKNIPLNRRSHSTESSSADPLTLLGTGTGLGIRQMNESGLDTTSVGSAFGQDSFFSLDDSSKNVNRKLQGDRVLYGHSFSHSTTHRLEMPKCVHDSDNYENPSLDSYPLLVRSLSTASHGSPTEIDISQYR